MFVINHKEITCCGNCPENREYPNAILGILPMKEHLPAWFLKIFSPTHRCRVALDTIMGDPSGRLILDPNRIPAWCVFEYQGKE